MAHIYIFDKDDNFLKILSEDEFNNDEHKRQLNGSWTFRFEVSIGYANDLLKGHKIGFYDRENEFRLFTIAEVPEATYHEDILDVYCTNDYFDLVDGIVEDKRIREGSAREALAKVLDGTKFEIGEVADLGLRTINFYDISRMEALQNIVKTYGGEIDYRIELNNSKTGIARRIIDLKARLGSDTGLRYTFDSNLKAVKRTDVSEGHFTVLYGRGKGIESGDGYSNKIKFTDIEWNTPLNPIDKPLGQSYIEDEEAIAKWGRIEGIYENSDIEDPEELLQETYKVLQQVKIPTLSYEVSAEDLSNHNGYEHFKTTIGDSVILLDEDYNLNLESRIVEITESIKSVEAEQSLILGYIQPSFTDSSGNSQITAPSFIESGTGDIEVDDTNFPNTLPQTPILKAKGLFSSVMLEWTFESKTYYNYEIYASEIQHFNPDSSNLIFRGKASSLLHEVKPSETWYYRARAINTHGEVTEMSDEVSATAFKISDATEYFEDVAIKEALIDTLSLDRGWFGQLKGQFMDVKNLVVTDGNNIRTMYVDDFGRVHMNVSELKINSKDVLNQEQTETIIETKAGEISLEVAKKEIDIARGEITDKIAQINIDVDSITNEVSSIKDSSFGGNNLVTNGNFSNGTSHWEATKYNGPGIFEFAVFNEDNSNSWCLNNKKIGWCSAEALPIEESVIGEWALCQEFDTVIGQTYTVSYFISGHRSSKSVVIRNGLGTL
ncbi:phage tail protein, partial [Turicibacter sanguinis]|uniref:phage tail protein n=1 Tax=Turicibacter sanguinis TaxID=154288 RepID=UPI0021D4B8E2